MSQELKHIATQKNKATQKNVAVQKPTHLQILQIRLTGMSLPELEEDVQSQLLENTMLESEESSEYTDTDEDYSTSEYDSGEEPDKVDVEPEPDNSSSETIQGDDDMPEPYVAGNNYRGKENEEFIYGNQVSFYDELREQIGMRQLSDTEEVVLDYLIGSLDDDGLLRKSPDVIIEELAIYYNVYISVEEMDRIIGILQEFEPVGIGARNLQECLLLQIKNKEKNEMSAMMFEVISKYFEDFIHKHWTKIRQRMNLSEEKADQVFNEIRKLNPKPGASLGETESAKIQQITPDFIIDTSYEGNVTFTINNGKVPELYISRQYSELLEEKKNSLSKRQKENVAYLKRNLERAKDYIEALKQRRHTLYVTMKAIIDIQKKYFQEGDESDLKPMRLKDVAGITGLDISTISRVCNMKYAQTRWGIFKLRHFFTNGYVTGNGVELSTRKIKIALKDIVDHEDKSKPLSDEEISDLLKKRSFSIARRTVSKYRDQLNIPKMCLRKK